MKRLKRIASLVLSIMLILSVIPTVTVHAGAITADEMRNKIEQLKAEYRENTKWNDSFAGGTQCWGFAHLCYNRFFGEYLSSAYVRRDVANLCVGDWVRFRPTPTSAYNHSIFVTNIIGDTVYYADCNADGHNTVHWDNRISKSELQKKINYQLSYFIQETGTGYIKTQKDNWVKTLEDTPDPIHKDNNIHVRNGYFTFKNAASGTFLNVWGGVDRDEQQITTWSFDDSIDQRFNVVHQGGGKYRLYAECSSNGSNRVVDIRRGSNPVTEGQSVELWPPTDDTSQLFYIWPVNNTEFVFEIASKEGYVIAPNASAAGSNSLESLLRVQRYTGGTHQRWILCNNNGQPTVPFVTYAPGSYKVNTGGTPIRLRTGPGVNSEVITTVPDQTILRVTQVNENWGYTNFNGRDGWVLLDFTEYTVTLDSISITKLPNKMSYYAGDRFESDGMEISANYSNGQKETITSGFSTSCDLSHQGEQTVTVSYKGLSTSFTVYVDELAVNSISLYSTDIKKQYYVGDEVDKTEISILINYSNNSGNLIVDGYDLNYDFSTPGRKTVTITYGGKTTSYEVEVFERPDDGKPLISVGSADCCAGDVIEVPVSLRANDIYDGNFTIQYDSSKMSVIKTTAQGALANRQTIINDAYDTGKIRVSFAGTTPVSCNGDILKIIFKINDGAVGSADVAVGDMRMYNIDGGAVDCGIANGAVSIQSPVGSSVVSNVQVMTTGGRKVVTADVAAENAVCYLASYSGEELAECDMQSPSNGKAVLSVTDNGSPVKLMVWDKNMRPLIQARSLY